MKSARKALIFALPWLCIHNAVEIHGIVVYTEDGGDIRRIPRAAECIFRKCEVERMIEKVAIVGMGALGLLYGTYIDDHTGSDAGDRGAVSFLLDEERLARYQDKIFTVNERVVAPTMESARDASPADLVIVAVKYNDLQSALDTMADCIGEDTIIMSVLNGITSEDIIAERYGYERIVYTVAQGMDAVKIGDDLTYSQMGNLHIGVPKGMDDSRLKRAASYFEKIKMPYIVEEDIVFRMWSKFMLNVGVNQTCMVYETDYEGCLLPGEAHDTFLAAMKEVKEIANAEGVAITDETIDQYIGIIRSLKPGSIPSMRQDSIQKRKTEVDMFAGTVIEIAEKHGIPVPANEFLFCRAKEIEASY